MRFDKIHNVYFLGIGGIGMSALARLFLNEGKLVAGYDRISTDLTNSLESEGAVIHYDDQIESIPDKIKNNPENTLVIITPAIPKEHNEWRFLTEHGFTIKKRSEVVGIISENKKTIAISGTHGKTTVTTLTAHLINNGTGDCLALLGGISKNYNSNVIINKNASQLVVEADEYDRSFLRLRPDVAVITSIDPDHLDIYGDVKEINSAFETFVSQIVAGGTLIIKKSVENRIKVPASVKKYTYSVNIEADFYATNIILDKGKFVFDIVTPGNVIKSVYVGVPAWINIENSVAATAAAISSGLEVNKVADGLKSFAGTVRRFDIRYSNGSIIYIDDYAHHPEEIKALVKSIRKLYPDRKITGIFQPHLYTRTRDMVDDFATSLSLIDNVWLLDIYPARELPIPGITSKVLLDRIHTESKKMIKKEEVIETIKAENPELLVTIGAGDIDTLINPIVNFFEKKQ